MKTGIIRTWMEEELENNWQDYDDPEMVVGNLAEKAIDKFLDGDGTLNELDTVWTLAHEVASEWEADNEVESESWTEKSQDYWRTIMR